MSVTWFHSMYMKYKTKFVNEKYGIYSSYKLSDWMQYIEILLQDKSSFVHHYNLREISKDKKILDQFCPNMDDRKYNLLYAYFSVFQYLENVKKIYSLPMFEVELGLEI